MKRQRAYTFIQRRSQGEGLFSRGHCVYIYARNFDVFDQVAVGQEIQNTADVQKDGNACSGQNSFPGDIYMCILFLVSFRQTEE